MDSERRFVRATDLEVRRKAGTFIATGHAATFNEPYGVGDFLEQVHPRAFHNALRNPDVKALWNHNADNVLGSVGSGTLRLSTDTRGLLTETDFPKSALREREAIERGDVSQMSFGFRTIADRWEKRADGTELRTLLHVELFDVSPCAFPANAKTDVSVAQRSRAIWQGRGSPGAQRVEHAYRVRFLELEALR